MGRVALLFLVALLLLGNRFAPLGLAQDHAPRRIRVAGDVQARKLLRRVPGNQSTPEYPAAAKRAHIQGTVRFVATIGTDGAVKSLQLVSGHPLLVPAARRMVSEWLYAPTLLKGEPVEVLTTLKVNSNLSPEVVEPPSGGR